MPGHGNATSIILNRHATIGVDSDRHRLGEIGHRLVNRIIDDLIDQMMQTARGCITNVHPGSLSNVLEVGQVLQIRVGIVRICSWNG